jgi:hypothetical protein
MTDTSLPELERQVRSVLLQWADGRKDSNDTPACMVRSWHMDLARVVAEALTHTQASGWADAVHVVFDGPPGHESGRFVECETPDGRGINAGEWHERPNGLWELRILGGGATAALIEALERIAKRKLGGPFKGGQVVGERREMIEIARAALTLAQASGVEQARQRVAAEVEGDSDSPLRVAEANAILAGRRDASSTVYRELATERVVEWLNRPPNDGEELDLTNTIRASGGANAATVEQTDRDAAAQLVRLGCPGLSNGNKVVASEIKGGLHDNYLVVQTFARHRAEALTLARDKDKA